VRARHQAGQGFRVLALADKKHPGNASDETRPQDEKDLYFIGLVALMDPLRPTVRETVAGMHRAGIEPMMITGDHPAIARYIAEEAGIIAKHSGAETVLTGDQLDEILTKSARPDSRAALAEARVFARVKPEHKLLLIEHFQMLKYRIAMTGDGINDAAAIKKADVGIAMSNGVDLTKDIADVVITGTYDALLRAVSVGRTVKLRTQLYLHYLLSGNSCQVGIFFVAVLFNWPIPLTSVMLLLINLFTDALPAMAMAVEPEDPDIVKKKVTQLSQRILTGTIFRGIIVQAILATIMLSGVFAFFLPAGLAVARTAVFTTYIFQKAVRGFTARSFTKSVFQYGFFTNRLMNIALVTVVAAWIGVTQLRPEWFGMVQLPLQTSGALLGVAMVLPVIEELTKLANRRLFSRST
jgi:Ca2+-transporting ATPase